MNDCTYTNNRAAPADFRSIRKQILQGKRIGPQEALALFSGDLIEIGRLADLRRQLMYPGEEVGFIVDRIINFTNVCEAACSFCAFHARGKQLEAYTLSDEEILDKVGELRLAGGTQVMLQGGLHPSYTLDRYEELVNKVKSRFPDIWLHSFSPAELVHMSRTSRLPLEEVVSHLKAAGLDSVPGASDLLVERIRRRVSPRKLTVAEWCEVMETLAKQGMGSSATMTYGMGETLSERIEHLQIIREVQDRTGIIRAFIPWSFSPQRTLMADMTPATGVDYLKVVAVSRIFLDNVRYIQAGWLTEGLKLAQVALAMGANDIGGVLTEEIVVKATGVETKTTAAELVDVIRNAGKIPVQRDSAYRVIRRM
ncbi:MAG TPA: CofH family radical SAM protein [Thermodesulfobacteriota bacterium]|nr:CofH family radical SAM protein [Thermodesulfobacteriota bacterium]HOC38262.1 CofH family radical SAM protein [Thermodesulfobacteriota bacterium]HQO77399.1 CofH family radical SAM protein [Thermodesulfobacteriota bacterium]